MFATITHYWYFGFFAIIFIILLTQLNQAVLAIRHKIIRFRLRLLFFISDRLEPDTIANFRRTISETFNEVTDFLERSELELLRSRIDNVFLKEKIQDLERNRETLLQELSGSPDFLSIEFSVWKRAIEVMDFLVRDRIALLEIITTLDSYNGNAEQLIGELATAREKNDAASRTVTELSQEVSLLSTKNEQLLYMRNSLESLNRQHQESIKAKSQELRRVESKVSTLNERITKLERTEVALKRKVDESNAEVDQFKKIANQNLEKVETLEATNQELIDTNEKIEHKLNELTVELVQKNDQIQQLQGRLRYLGGSQSHPGSNDSDMLEKGNYRLRRKVSRLRKYLRQAHEQLDSF